VTIKTPDTGAQYDAIMAACRDTFMKKMKDYGPSWRILRTSSITDQIYIKARRIRSIEEKGTMKVDEGIRPEYEGIINYSIIALIQLELGAAQHATIDAAEADTLFEKYAGAAKSLMLDKNHDYGEAWRNMRRSSLTDIILMRLMRIKQIEDNEGQTFVSEGVDANYYDIVNYAVFSLIKMDYENS